MVGLIGGVKVYGKFSSGDPDTSKTADFKIFKSQYLFIFAGGLLGVFIVFVIMYMIGIGQLFCIAFGIIMASILVWLTFYLNDKYEEHGLIKKMALSNHPRYIINRKQFKALFITLNLSKYEKCIKSLYAGK